MPPYLPSRQSSTSSKVGGLECESDGRLLYLSNSMSPPAEPGDYLCYLEKGQPNDRQKNVAEKCWVGCSGIKPAGICRCSRKVIGSKQDIEGQPPEYHPRDDRRPGHGRPVMPWKRGPQDPEPGQVLRQVDTIHGFSCQSDLRADEVGDHERPPRVSQRGHAYYP